jgi:hypothetical protein
MPYWHARADGGHIMEQARYGDPDRSFEQILADGEGEGGPLEEKLGDNPGQKDPADQPDDDETDDDEGDETDDAEQPAGGQPAATNEPADKPLEE